MRGLLTAAVMAAVGLLPMRSALSWWDTVITTERPVPLMREIEAETCSGPAKADIVWDDQADGGKGGRAVLLRPGGPGLTTEVDVKPGIYAIFTIARDPEGRPDEHGIFTQRNQWGLLTLEVKEHATGATRSWTMVIVYREQYFAVGMMYFPAHAGGKYTVTVRLPTEVPRLPKDPAAIRRFFDANTRAFTKQPLGPLLVDRLELRDALGHCARRAAKTRRTLTSDEELAQLRQKQTGTTYKPPDAHLYREPYVLTDGRPLTPEERRARNEKLWNLVPDFNEHVSTDAASPYSYLFGRDSNGMVLNAITGYRQTGNPEYAWDGAVLLCAVAEKFPALDFLAQGVEGGVGVNLQYGFTFNALVGKHVYRGWAGGAMINLAQAYDDLFDFIKDNQELAAFVGTKIPWVKSPADVLALLDIYLLQSGMDYCKRHYISSDDAKAFIPLVQGVGPVADEMLATGIFDKIAMNMSLRGGIDDQAICSFSRDGVHYIGSASYLTTELQDIAAILHRYRLAGGSPRFDLLDSHRYPQMTEAVSTMQQLRVAGGFRLLIGDAQDLRKGREADMPPFPSRILGGFGAAILESGQYSGDPLAMRAVGVRTGIGRGHAHQDTLNIEIFAHGCRMSPDLGGRHEPPRKGSPNMRSNKVHNLVEVDLRDFENPYPGSTTSATGWTVSFHPQPGAQFMSNAARATSHPNVSLYARDTALIDAGPTDSYLFDVFRVIGGKVHTYNFHGAPCTLEAFRINTEMKEATSDAAVAYLAKHKEGTRREGKAPAMLEADWPMDANLQQSYQGASYQKDSRATMRLTLFGREGEDVFVGNTFSDVYAYNFPILHVQGRQEQEGRQSVYPALMEPFAGEPLIVAKRLLAVTQKASGARAGVALAVVTRNGFNDRLYASATPDDVAQIEGGWRVAGRFGYVSTDKDGLRLAHLVGGTELSAAEVTIQTERARWTGTIRAVDYANRAFTVDQALPASLLKGHWVCIDNGRLIHNFRLSDLKVVGGETRITHEKTAQYYQSAIVNVNPAASTVEVEIEPPVFGCDPNFASGTTVTNERQDKYWKATLREGDRWMHIGHPGYRGSFPNKCSLADFPDADGDGRRIVRLINTRREQDAQGQSLLGKVLLEMEVTRVTPDGETFYFKLPKDEVYQRGGWAYAYQLLVNEDGSRRWMAKYPGSSFVWELAGGLTPADFTDADGDGKIKMAAYLFGPGDRMTLDTSVSVERGAHPGVYMVRSNVPCTIGLPRGDFARAEISADGKTFGPIAATGNGARLIVALSERDLRDGRVVLRLAR